MKYIKIVFLLAFTILFNDCKDIIFNNPLDPNAAKGVVVTIKILDTEIMGIGELSFDGEKLWKCSNSGNLIAFDLESGERIREISSLFAEGITFLDDYLYIATERNYLTLINSLSGDIVQNISTGELYFKFIVSYGNKIIGYDTKSASFFTFDPNTGESEKLFSLTGFNIGGIDIYKNNLILTEINSSSIYIFDLNGEVKSVYSSPATEISGIAVDQTYYVYISSSDGKVYKVSIP